MIVYRLSKSRYSKDLSGRGAEIAGGRWNSKGTAMVYTGQSRALCTVEIAVHTTLGNVPMDYDLVTLEIPDKTGVHEVSPYDLPADWKSFPHAHATQEIGDLFTRSAKYLVMCVPSAVIQDEYNYLINPRHTDMSKIKLIKVEPFSFDPRLFGKPA
jgi:RES domain-containing protein